MHSFITLFNYNITNHTKDVEDQYTLAIRQRSKDCLRYIQNSGDAQDFADLVNVGYGKVICISFSTAGGIGEVQNQE
ncbi:MAG: hypothetical protein EZS28_055940, partial [Streblomastix strix]